MEIKIPSYSILVDTITVGGYKFFYRGKDIQCATCLQQAQLLGDGLPIRGKVTNFKVIKDCDCPKQK
jgi:hypothetical protein